MLIDTHAHMYDQVFAHDLPALMERSQQAHVKKILMPCLESASISAMLSIAQKYPNICLPMVGLHPCYVKEDVLQQLNKLEAYLTKHKFIAIGEIGMDLYHDTTYQNSQKIAFEQQIDWAKHFQLPLVLHVRDAYHPVIEILAQKQDGRLKGIWHCFGGSIAQAERIIDLGFLLGIGGIVTFKNANLAAVLSQVSLQHIVLETDSPYLAPMPHRGSRNEPSYITQIANMLATIYDVDINHVAHTTTKNAQQVFGSSLLEADGD